MKKVQVGKILIEKKGPLTFIIGPCVIEDRDHALYCAEQIKTLFSNQTNMQCIFKASFDKANRSSIHSFRGPGLQKGLKILEEIKTSFDLPVTSDVHLPSQLDEAKQVLDLIQIPAFLARQTDLLTAAAKTALPVNVKKAQFMAPWDMESVVEKLHESNAQKIILTDRGTCFGYNNLVSDFRSIPIMQKFHYPVCYDASHSVQLPGGQKTHSGGNREFINPLCKAAIAAGADLIFLETHPCIEKAKCDKDNAFIMQDLKPFLQSLCKIYEVVQQC